MKILSRLQAVKNRVDTSDGLGCFTCKEISE